MFRKLSILALALVTTLCFICITPVSAKNVYDNYMHHRYINRYQPPGKTIETEFIISFLSPYIHDAFDKQKIQAKEFIPDTTTITSIEKLPNNKFKVSLYIRTFGDPSFSPPYGYYDVTVITDGNSVEVTEITPVGR